MLERKIVTLTASAANVLAGYRAAEPIEACHLCGTFCIHEEMSPSFWLPGSKEDVEVDEPICMDCIEAHCVTDPVDGEYVMKPEAVDRFREVLKLEKNWRG